jgi:hypothetical protein
MEIEITDEQWMAFEKAGWSIVRVGRKTWLVDPKGRRLSVTGGHRATTGNLYVIHGRHSTRFKFGISENPSERLRELQIGSPILLDLVRSVKVESWDTEKKAHALMRRYSAHGEWFDLGTRAQSFRCTAEGCKTADDVLGLMVEFVAAENKMGFCFPNRSPTIKVLHQ